MVAFSAATGTGTRGRDWHLKMPMQPPTGNYSLSAAILSLLGSVSLAVPCDSKSTSELECRRSAAAAALRA